MSSEILTPGAAPSASPMFWRTVDADLRVRLDPRNKTADRELALRVDQARREAFGEGVEAGRKETEKQILPALEGIARSLSELDRMKDTIRNQATEELVHLAVSIAARVIHREVTVDSDALAGLVRAAFAKVQSRELQRVRLHPGMERLVLKHLDLAGAPKTIEISADAGLNPGDVLFETSQGALDASVETQLREVERGLIDKLER